ncbi:MAG: molybdopterin-synthase adenylyltransferase MoeB [Verrucomicrobiota bacterium]
MSYLPRIAEAFPEMAFSNDEIKRYGRHLIMPEVTLEGQKKLKAARVLCIGTGGLGSPLLAYLTAAGVGRIGLVDYDTVDYSNLQRQIIHKTSNLGKPKIDSAIETMKEINPYVEVDRFETSLRSDNALDIMRDYDVIVDGTDNFPTRYLVNDACVLLGKPNVYGSLFRFEGQATIFWAEKGPCYRCLYPDPPPPELVPSCAEGGVLGVLPGVIGVIQAIETVKLIIGRGDLLIGRLVVFDALKMRFKELKVRKDPACPICGENPTVTELIDYEMFCGTNVINDGSSGVPEVEVDEFAGIRENGGDFDLVDVREPHEYEIAKLEPSLNLPMSTFSSRLHELDSSREIYVICKNGQRSTTACKMLHTAGFRKIKHVEGGFEAWAEEVDESFPIY